MAEQLTSLTEDVSSKMKSLWEIILTCCIDQLMVKPVVEDNFNVQSLTSSSSATWTYYIITFIQTMWKGKYGYTKKEETITKKMKRSWQTAHTQTYRSLIEIF